jgi:hypothetical protein
MEDLILAGSIEDAGTLIAYFRFRFWQGSRSAAGVCET